MNRPPLPIAALTTALLGLAGCSSDAARTAQTTTMPTTPIESARRIPPIDATTPDGLQTATFALG